MRCRASTASMLAAALASLLAVALAHAGTTGDLSGRVTNEKGEPLQGVNLRIEGQRLGALSDEQGNYFLIGVPAGEYVVKANLLGYAAFSAEKVAITPDFTTKLDIKLKVEAVPMQEVKVEAER